MAKVPVQVEFSSVPESGLQRKLVVAVEVLKRYTRGVEPRGTFLAETTNSTGSAVFNSSTSGITKLPPGCDGTASPLMVTMRTLGRAATGMVRVSGMSGTMRTALGLMSGTSMDGIDLSLIETDGEEVSGFGPWATLPYPADLRERLGAAVAAPDALDVANRAALAAEITRAHALAVETFLERHGIAPGRCANAGVTCDRVVLNGSATMLP